VNVSRQVIARAALLALIPAHYVAQWLHWLTLQPQIWIVRWAFREPVPPHLLRPNWRISWNGWLTALSAPFEREREPEAPTS
jgi:hypothetical protein